MNTLYDALLPIIVLYETSLDESESFQSLVQVKKAKIPLNLLVYDNSARPQKIAEYESLKIEYLHDPGNSGVSRAYNYGAQLAKERGLEWVLVLDQDTAMPPDFLEHYAAAVSEYPSIHLFAPVLRLAGGSIFSPFVYKFNRGFPLDSVSVGIHSLFRIAPVNSGLLIRVRAFMECGGYNEKVRLDFSDFQFIRRFRTIYPEFCVIGTSFIQDFSDEVISTDVQLNRFRFYCEGALAIEKDNFADRLTYAAVVLARAIKLSIRFKTPKFVAVYLRQYLNG